MAKMHSSTDHPWLRRDTFFTDTGSGLQLANASTGFEITGSSAYRLFRTIHPFLDGSHSLQDIKNATGDRWPIIERFLKPLTDHGFIRWIPATDFEVLPERERSENSDQIAYLAQFTDTPHASFSTFSSAKILVLGDSPFTVSLVTNLRDNGARGVSTHPSAPMGLTNREEPFGQDVDLIVLAPETLHLLENLEEHLVLAVTGYENQLRALTRPWPDLSSFTWLDAAASLGLSDPHQGPAAAARELLEHSAAVDERVMAEPIQRMFGALLAYEIFKGLTGAIRPETADKVLVLNGLTGETTTHPVAPSPEWGEPQRKETPAPASQPLDIASSRAEEYDAAWAKLVDPMTLPAEEFTDLELEQVPVKVSSLTSKGSTVHGASLWTTADARIETLCRAYENYFSTILPPTTVSPSFLGVDRDPEQAALRAVRSAACAKALSSDRAAGKECELFAESRAGHFIRSTAPEMKYTDLGEHGGWHVGLAYDHNRWAVTAAPELSEALITAAVEVLGARQADVPLGHGNPERFLGTGTREAVFFEVRRLPNELADSLNLCVVEATWRAA